MTVEPLDPLTGTCPTCGSAIGVTCYTAGGKPCTPHAARKGVARDGIRDSVHRYVSLQLNELSKLHPGSLSRDDVIAANTNALKRYDYGEGAS